MKRSEKKAREKTNPLIKEAVITLNKTKAKAWKDVARRITAPTRQNKGVPLSRISKYTAEGDTVVIPGKVLGNGDINHSITLAATGYSKKASEKLKEAKCKTMSILELAKKNPEGKNIKIIG